MNGRRGLVPPSLRMTGLAAWLILVAVAVAVLLRYAVRAVHGG